MATSIEIGRIVHRAIVSAHDDFETITGGCWMWVGPEYFLTVAIAQELHESLGGDYPVLLEYPVFKASQKDLDPIVKPKPGRKTKVLPEGSCVDCVLFDPKDRPVAVIEVKKESSSNVKDDIQRLVQIMSHSTRKYPGILAYWGSWGTKYPGSDARKFVQKLDMIIDDEITGYDLKHTRTFESVGYFHDDTPGDENDSAAYLAYCAVIERGK